MIWINPDDPEDGYFDDEQCDFGLKDRPGIGGRVQAFDDDGVRICYVEKADCSHCGGTLSDDAKIPLCVGCQTDFKREVKEQQAHREWVADGSPR